MRLQLVTQIYALLFGLFLLGPVAQAQTTGTFMVVKGDVTVKSKDGKVDKAKIGKKVIASDTIITGADSRAKIVMADKNVINLSPDTQLLLEKYIYDPANGNKNVSLNVLQGKVRATVEQKYDGEKNQFNVKTPAAVAGVRGTDFLTSYNSKSKESRIVTFEGRVAVGQPGPGGQIMNPVIVSPGQQTTASVGAPPAPPSSVPNEEMSSINEGSKAESNEPSAKEEAPGQEKKEDKDKKEKDNNKDKSKNGNNGVRGEPAADNRAPTSDSSGASMIDYSADVGGVIDSGIAMPTAPLTGAGIYDPTTALVAQPPPTSTFINNTLVGGKTQLSITILPQAGP